MSVKSAGETSQCILNTMGKFLMRNELSDFGYALNKVGSKSSDRLEIVSLALSDDFQLESKLLKEAGGGC